MDTRLYTEMDVTGPAKAMSFVEQFQGYTVQTEEDY